MLASFGFTAEFTVLMLMERFGPDAEPLRRFISESLLRSTIIASAGVLALAGVLHAIRIVRAKRATRPKYLGSVWIVGFSTIFLQILTILMIGLSGGMPR